MALTLPYPSLDFVPLDVLTAEEMNQIVANYTYISNQFPISQANLATAVQNKLELATALQSQLIMSYNETWSPSGGANPYIDCPASTGSSDTTIFFTVPVGKNLASITSVSCTSLEAIVTADGTQYYPTLSNVQKVTKTGPSTIRVDLYRSGGWSDIPNHHACTVSLGQGTQFRFT